MPLEPIKQKTLEDFLEMLRSRNSPQEDWPFQLARFAEAAAIGEGNRQIEELKKSLPKPLGKLPNKELSDEDLWKISFKLRSALFDFFLWCLEDNTPGMAIGQIADEATVAVYEVLKRHAPQEEADATRLDK